VNEQICVRAASCLHASAHACAEQDTRIRVL
jgi:hypothetical protein